MKIDGKQDQGNAAEGRDAGEGGPRARPLLDLSDAAVKELIRSAKKRGYVTHDQINALLSSEEVKSEQIEDILAKFSEIGVNVVETKEAELEEEVATREEPEEEAEGENELVEVQQGNLTGQHACLLVDHIETIFNEGITLAKRRGVSLPVAAMPPRFFKRVNRWVMVRPHGRDLRLP